MGTMCKVHTVQLTLHRLYICIHHVHAAVMRSGIWVRVTLVKDKVTYGPFILRNVATQVLRICFFSNNANIYAPGARRIMDWGLTSIFYVAERLLVYPNRYR